MQSFRPTASERAAGAWSPERLDQAVRAIETDGIVVLRDVVSRASIEVLEARMQEDVARAIALGRVKNDYQGIRPPPFHPFLFADVVNNDWVIAVTRSVLGENVANCAYGANTAYPGSLEQFVHADGGFIFKGLPHPPASLVVNVPLVDVDERNGATRVWPGTHVHVGARDPYRPTAEEVAAWEAVRPSERACTSVGDIVIRDCRLWHCGMPNTTDRPRPMLAMIHNRGSLMGGFVAEEGSEDFFASHPLLGHRVAFAPKPIDYLRPHHEQPAWTVALRKRAAAAAAS